MSDCKGSFTVGKNFAIFIFKFKNLFSVQYTLIIFFPKLCTESPYLLCTHLTLCFMLFPFYSVLPLKTK